MNPAAFFLRIYGVAAEGDTVMKPTNILITACLLTASATLPDIAIAHDGGDNDAGTAVCLEANYMVADAMNAPDSSNPGMGQVIEQNIITGERGITVNNPFGIPDPDVCPDGVVCPGPWKPTGTFSGGMNGHAFITSAAQHALTEFHRDGTAIRTVSYNGVLGTPGAGFGHVPRPLGSQIMPNGNLIQAICDANFFNAGNSDPIGPGEDDPAGNGNSSSLYFPPVYSTPQRAANSRLLVIDQETMEVIDEYSQPPKWIRKWGYGRTRNPAHDLWGCAAGIMFDSDYMYVSTFHGGAVLKIDWRSGIDRHSRGVGSNVPHSKHRPFKIGKHRNRARVDGIIDMIATGPDDYLADLDDPNRRDTMRAITFDEEGNVYGTNRRRSRECLRGEYPSAADGCNPGVFRQRVSIADAGNDWETDTLALDPGVNIIAGIRINRMSARGCDFVIDEGGTQNDCNVETLYVAASAMNPGCVDVGPLGANPCFTRGGYIAEYRIDVEHRDGGNLAGDGSGNCNGDPNDPAGNMGCAEPIATFGGLHNGDDNIDPRMLMPIQRGFIQ